MKVPKPQAPTLKEINITEDINCTKTPLLCDIVNNMSELLKYVCKLEASPAWEGKQDLVCPVDEL